LLVPLLVKTELDNIVDLELIEEKSA